MNTAAIMIIIAVGAAVLIEAVGIFIRAAVSSSYGFDAVIVIEPEEDAEEKLESIFSRLRWTDNEMIKKIIIVNNDSDSLKNDICNRYCTKNPAAVTVNTGELLNLLIPAEK